MWTGIPTCFSFSKIYLLLGKKKYIHKQLFGNNLLTLRGIAHILILVFRYYADDWIQLLQATAGGHTSTYLFWGCWDTEPCVCGTWISLLHWKQVKQRDIIVHLHKEGSVFVLCSSAETESVKYHKDRYFAKSHLSDLWRGNLSYVNTENTCKGTLAAPNPWDPSFHTYETILNMS